MKVEKEQEQGNEHFENEKFTKEFYLQGATSMLGLLVSQGMPPQMLDDLEEAIWGAKRGMGK